MYFVVSRLDAEKYCKLNFIVNFGVPQGVKIRITEFLESGGYEKSIVRYLETLDTMVLLKIHKYFFWADKKLHSVFFVEDKDQISEDMLCEFKDEDDDKGRFQKPEQYSKKAGLVEKRDEKPKVIGIDRSKTTITKEDLLFGDGKKKKTVNINDDIDFPDLGEDGDPFAALD